MSTPSKKPIMLEFMPSRGSSCVLVDYAEICGVEGDDNKLIFCLKNGEYLHVMGNYDEFKKRLKKDFNIESHIGKQMNKT